MPYNSIFDKLPHRYPFLFIDKIISIDSKYKGKGLKNITINEPYFQGHFPREPIVPGVILIEMIAQMGAIVSQEEEIDNADTVGYIAQVKNFKFLKMACPGDQLIIDVVLNYPFKNYIEIEGKILCDGAIIAKGTLIGTRKDENH